MLNSGFVFGEVKLEIEAFSAYVTDDICNCNDIFNCLSTQMKFPSYFGFNWNALYDMLTDFHWISEKNVYLLHKSAIKLPENDKRIYIEVLNDAVNDWRRSDDHNFFVGFLESEKTSIQGILRT